MSDPIEFTSASDTEASRAFDHWQHEHPAGLFINMKTGTAGTLHTVGCQHIGKPGEWDASFGDLTKCPKVCSDDMQVLRSWAEQRSIVLTECGDCVPRDGARVAGPSMAFGSITPARRQGHEAFHVGGKPLKFAVRDFWGWAASDLVSNAQRGVLAEFLVARALGVDHGVRAEWDAVDLRTADGIKIEVKSSGYIQTWHQEKPSSIGFDIAPKRGWDAATNTSAQERSRAADVYVFAVHAHQEQESLDPLDLRQWEFHVLATSVLEARCPAQKRISLGALKALTPAAVAFDELGAAIRAAVQA